MLVLILYWVILFTAYFIASRLRKHRDRFSFLPHLTMGIVFAIILIMGMRMGNDEQVIGQLRSIGLRALIVTIACVGGSMLAVFGVRKIIGMDRYGNLHGSSDSKLPVKETTHPAGQKATTKGEQKSTLAIIAFFIIGILIGVFALRRASDNFLVSFDEISGTATSVLLYILVGVVGVDLGLSGEVVVCLKAVGIHAFIFPLAAIIGSLAMGTLSGYFLGFSVREGLAISAGFGWYTYSPVVIANAGPEYAVASAVALLCNMIRETPLSS